jgi:Fe-S oxidoreductase
MAKMKSDVSQIYYDEHGTRLRDRLIRDSSLSAEKLSGIFAQTVNQIQRSKWFRSILEKLTGFDKRRILPAYTSKPFHKWFEKNNVSENKSAKKVVLYADTYLDFHEPQVGIAAYQLLNSCGYEVILAKVGCCQRPKISHGFLREAKKEGAKTIEGLRKYLEQGLTVVVCEPSCASAFTDDLADLIEDDALAVRLQEQVMMLDVFLAKEIESGKINVDFVAVAENILIHGHCHQKALYGTDALKMILRKTGRHVEEIPSGCCGMAGSFGYEKEHYEISEKIGENILFPAIRSMKDDAIVVANGFSCRHQIEHFTGVKPKHWVEVVSVRRKGATPENC